MADGLFLFGKIALKNKLLTRDQLEEALLLQEEARKIGLQENLGTVCIRLGYLTGDDVDKILGVQLRKETRDSSKLYGGVALQNKMISSAQLEEALRVQKEQNSRSPLGQHLLKLGHISFKDHQAVLQVIERVKAQKGGAQTATSLSAQIADKKQDIQKNLQRKKEGSPSSRQKATRPFVPPPAKSPKALQNELANLIPGYTLTKKLGQGAMGVVYKGIQTSLEKEVAVKILPPDFARDESRMERFIREARSLGKLSHPNIIKALNMGQIKGYGYYVMEYVRGKTLDRLIREELIFKEPRALKIVRAIASALGHAWKHSIVHRDIKPENIMISEDGQIKLCDLGLAKCLHSQEQQVKLTMAGTTVGTPLYMSPEQAKGEAVDIRTDIYALGVSLFEMVTGKPPYMHKSPLIVMQMHLMDPVPLAKDQNPQVSQSTSTLISQMMEKDTSARISSPEKVVEIIDSILSGRSYPAKAPSKKGFLGLRKKSRKKSFRKRL